MAAKKDTGLANNVAGALSYVLGPVTGVIFFVINSDPFVRFHAVQSILVFAALFVLQAAMGITLILLPLVPLVGLAGFILWLLLIWKAYRGEKWEVPFLGKYVNVVLSKVK